MSDHRSTASEPRGWKPPAALIAAASVIVGAASMPGAGYAVSFTAVVFIAEYTGQAAAIVPGLLAMTAVRLVVGSRSVSGGQVP